MMYRYLQVRHTKTGDEAGQALVFNTRDEYLLEYHSKMKNAINDATVIGMDVLVVDEQLNEVFKKKWIREAVEEATPEPIPEPEVVPEEPVEDENP